MVATRFDLSEHTDHLEGMGEVGIGRAKMSIRDMELKLFCELNRRLNCHFKGTGAQAPKAHCIALNHKAASISLHYRRISCKK